LAHEELTEEQAVTEVLQQPNAHEDVVQLTPLVRRVLRARVRNPDVVEDLVQETLVRVIEARPRIRDDGLSAYAVVTARNLAKSLGRAESSRRDHLHRLADTRTPPDPEEETLRQEEAEAVSAALGKLSPREKDAVVAREVGGKDTATVAREMGSTPGGVAVQLARARAKLRVDYLLALTKTSPPSPVCRPVLVALSAGDRRRQQALHAGDHLLTCELCAELSEPVLQRKRGLAALLPVAGLQRMADGIATGLKTPRGQAVTAGATATAVAAAIVVANLGGSQPSQPRPPQGPLFVAGAGRMPTSASRLEDFAGKHVSGERVLIESVPADEGFWIGEGKSRVFVRLTKPTESGFKARAGQRVTFGGTIVRNDPRLARRIGVTRAEGGAGLRPGLAHIEAPQSNVELR
jgi:RNA polymerase sigma factor (sigma-70 family)